MIIAESANALSIITAVSALLGGGTIGAIVQHQYNKKQLKQNEPVAEAESVLVMAQATKTHYEGIDTAINSLLKVVSELESRLEDSGQKIDELEKLIDEQTIKITEQNNRLDEQTKQMNKFLTAIQMLNNQLESLGAKPAVPFPLPQDWKPFA